MEIVFTTLSLGLPYTKDYCLKLIKDVLDKTHHSIYVTTDFSSVINEAYPNNSRIIINEITREDLKLRINTDWGTGFADDFNFNMRYMCFDQVKDLENNVVIFTDCDNSLDWWDEEKIQNWLETQVDQGFDFFGPRNDYKFKVFLDSYEKESKKESGLFWHKLYNYDLINNPKEEWEDSPLPAEYLLIFFNKEKKLIKFFEQWKWFHDYLVNQDKSYGTWAEGFEIGVSSHVAGFKAYDIGWNHPIWSKAITANGYKVGHPTEK